MEKMSKEMIKHCGGLPLAINVLGSLLAEKYTPQDWKRVSENIGSHLMGGRNHFNDGNKNSLNHVLSLSFEELPSKLKHCFLYLAHFPDDHIIDIEKLSYYWAAEGIFEAKHNDVETIRDVGESYIEELVRRNMIISERDVTTSRFETCHFHDIMREMCLVKAKEQNFLQIMSGNLLTANSPSTYKSRRLVYHYQNTTTLQTGGDIENPKLRSVVFLPGNDYVNEHLKLSVSSFTRLELLRVLDLFKADFGGGKLMSGIGKLIHLRYLSLKAAKEVSHLPSSLENLILLIYLDIDVDGVDIVVPNILKGMQDLRYLALPMVMHKKTKLELSKLVNLEALKGFSTKACNIEDLHVMVRLRTLEISVTSAIIMENIYASIRDMSHLEKLNIRKYDRYDRTLEVALWDFVNLEKLSLKIYVGKLPKVQRFPSQLTILDIRSLKRLEEDPMPILEKLFKLKEVTLRSRSFCGKKMICLNGGFPQLQKLSLVELDEWEDWQIEKGSMPSLQNLTIVRCPKLKQLPDGLQFITSLEELEMVCHDEKWEERLSEGGEDYKKVEHISSVKLSLYNDE